MTSAETKSKILEACHNDRVGGCHFGRDKTAFKVSQRYYWKKINSDVDDWAVAAEGIFVLGGWPRRARTNFYATLYACRVLRKCSRGTLGNVQHALVTSLKARGRDTKLV